MIFCQASTNEPVIQNFYLYQKNAILGNVYGDYGVTVSTAVCGTAGESSTLSNPPNELKTPSL